MSVRRFALLLTLATFTLSAASLLWAAGDDTGELEKKLQTLLQDRVATAEFGVKTNQAAYDVGAVTLDQLIQSRKDLAEARYAVAKTAPEREAALAVIVQGCRQVEEKVAALYKTASRGGEHNQLAMATLARQTAEIRLLEEQLRNAKGK